MSIPNHPADNVPAEWNEGDVILGVYEVRRLLGRGGMGSVYQVHHRGWDTDLAVKWPRPEALTAKRGAELFERECETWVNLGLHPNITACYYIRRLGGIPRVFAEFVSGGNLAYWIRHGKLYQGPNSLARLIDVAIQIAWGLRFAHAQGIIHLDMKPANVLLTPDGAAKVTDFGLARAFHLAAMDEGKAAARGGPRGTPAYNSPEQASREQTTPATDMWSWGLVVLEMFTGEVTWMAGPQALQAFENYLELGAERTEIPEMPGPMAELLRKCFQDDPTKRPANMGEIIGVLESVYQDACGTPYPRRVPESAESSPGRLNNRAVSLCDLGKPDEAKQLWERALRFEPVHLESLYNLTLLGWRRGRSTDQKIMRVMRDVCRARPKDWIAIYMFAQVRLERGDYEGALKLLRFVKGGAVDGHEVKQAVEEAEKHLGETRRLIKSFGQDLQDVSSVYMSWDGQRAVTATAPETGDGDLSVWDVSKAESCLRLSGHSGGIRCVALSADGLYVLSGGADGTARIWELSTGRCARVLKGHEGAVTAVSFADDGRRVLTAGEDGIVRLWDQQSGERLLEFREHKAEVTSLCMGVSGLSFMSAGKDSALVHWDIKNGGQFGAIHNFPAPLLSVAVSNDRRYVLAGSEDGFLEYLDLTTGKRLGRRKAHSEPVTAVCMSKRGRFALSGGKYGKVRLWETAGHRCLFTYKAEAPISVGEEGRVALTTAKEGGLLLWHVGMEAPIHSAPMMVCRA